MHSHASSDGIGTPSHMPVATDSKNNGSKAPVDETLGLTSSDARNLTLNQSRLSRNLMISPASGLLQDISKEFELYIILSYERNLY